jgi:hypothetical protein
VVERDGVFVARCSHRGCGARGPKHHDLTRACDLFCCPPQTIFALLDDADTAEYLAGQLQHAGLDAADDVRAVPSIALAAGLGADATAEEVAARVGEMARTLSLLGTWRHEYGAALKPSGADTYGEGMRAAKGQVGAILSHLAEEAGRG